MSPLAYILAPFALALALFVIHLIVSLIQGDPARPFRMFASRPLDPCDAPPCERPGKENHPEDTGA